MAEPAPVWISCGTFLMGPDALDPEERPARRVAVDGFWVDAHPVTAAVFRRFVQATEYVALAERPPNPADYPGIDPALLVPDSLASRRPPHRWKKRP